MQFIDQVKIFLKSGDGGAGCVSFRREKFIEFGGPDGGNGGRGGDIVFETCPHLNTLIDFRYRQHFKAEKGHHGMGSNRTGGSGATMLIKIPMGTEVLADDKETVLYDLVKPNEQLRILKGGDGGRGNQAFKTATNQAPRRSEPGWPGEEMWVWLRLKLMADVGLVGLPNAGKSTFLSSTTRANAKIGDYPFTTTKPQLGVVYLDDFEFVLADIPGLIEDAHKGTGLGDRFLGHIERCKILIHLIDGTSETIAQDFKTIEKELTEYGHGLMEKPRYIVLNKIDAMTDEEVDQKMQELQSVTKLPLLKISAAAKQNVNILLGTIVEDLKSEEN